MFKLSSVYNVSHFPSACQIAVFFECQLLHSYLRSGSHTSKMPNFIGIVRILWVDQVRSLSKRIDTFVIKKCTVWSSLPDWQKIIPIPNWHPIFKLNYLSNPSRHQAPYIIWTKSDFGFIWFWFHTCLFQVKI